MDKSIYVEKANTKNMEEADLERADPKTGARVSSSVNLETAPASVSALGNGIPAGSGFPSVPGAPAVEGRGSGSGGSSGGSYDSGFGSSFESGSRSRHGSGPGSSYAGEYGERLVTHTNPKSPVAEAYRILRTNLNFAALDKPFKTLLLTSPGPSEGKSTTLANLGIAMAQAGTRTLLMDCDLRKPLLHKLFGLTNWRGFTNLMVEKGVTLEEVIQDTPVPNLKVLTSGPLPPNPSELLASRRAAQVIEEAQERFQLVLIDSPPVVAVTDAAILSAKVDGVLLVIRSHETRINLALQAKNLLDKANAHIIGVVLNGVPIGGDDYYYYYYYGSGSPPGGQGAWQMLQRTLGAAWRRFWRRGRGGFEEDTDF